MTHALRSLALLPLLAACSGTDDSRPFTVRDAAGSGGDSSECTRGTLEDDFEPAPLAGPSVADGTLAPGNYVISSTYLQLRQDEVSQARFSELMGPIMADLQMRDGLMALSFGSSTRCGTARTLSVWRDDIAMLGFVSSKAHGAAISSVSQVSRGGSLVTHWTGSEGEAQWQTAADHVGTDEGPLY